jgi:hypothetical protein
VRALLLSLSLLLIAAPSAAAQDELTEAVRTLQDGTVYVAPGVDVDAGELREQVADSGVDMNVAVLSDGTSPDEVAGPIYGRLGEEVPLVVVAGDRIVAGPGADLRRMAGEAANENGGEGAQAVLADFIERVGDEDGGGGGGGGGAGGLIVLALAGAGGAAFAINRRQRRRREAAELAEVKENARDDLVALGEDIRALEVDMDMPGVPGEAKADYETAVNAYQRADQSWRLARRPEDLEPVGSALEEGRWAMQSARARLDGREPPERRSPCFFDPRHGPSTRDVEWAPPGGEPRMVPVCEADALRVEEGEDPEAREVTVGGQRMPYWAAGPMYAPFMGGFYGAGILPGLLIGTSLGGMWDTPSGDFGGGDWGGGDFGGGDFGGGDFGGGDF